ncbi:glyoxalase-like domain-containing protein [Hyaloscypha finlandica]|nr:glyoxalase-like domain-containing protein [Hyaloscypha finlandica]
MTPVYLDHIVILLPYKAVLSPPRWLTDNFTVIPGGRHAGGQTENKLVVFQDGSYIELIAFVDNDPKYRVGHRWGDKEDGIIDFALSSQGNADDNYEVLKSRLEKAALGLKYESPAIGGRTREDAQVLKWEVTVPKPPTKRGETPFFCHDVTARGLRVPFSKESTSHPNGGYGLAGLKIYVPKGRVRDLSKAYEGILDSKNSSSDTSLGRFEVKSLHFVEGHGKVILDVQELMEAGQQRLVAEKGVLLSDLLIGVTGLSNESGRTIKFDVEYESESGSV